MIFRADEARSVYHVSNAKFVIVSFAEATVFPLAALSLVMVVAACARLFHGSVDWTRWFRAGLGLAAGIAILFSIFAAPRASASDLEDLATDGYGVVAKTNVNGEFEGCDFDKRIPLQNGLIFVCQSYGYSYGYMADVLILKHVKDGDIKVIIDDDEYDGYLVRGR